MLLYRVVANKAYYAIRFEDIPAEWIMGGSCFGCGHKGPIDRFRVEKRHRSDEHLRFVDKHLRCLSCGSKDGNRFILVGRYDAEAGCI